MNIQKNTLLAGAAIALAAAGGFGIARLTGPATPAPAAGTKQEAAPGNDVTMDDDAIRISGIDVAPAAGGAVSALVLAAATVDATPDAEAVLTARATGTVTRIFKRIGDSVRAGETIALLESRDASAIAADRGAAVARVTLARRQLERERLLFRQGVSPRADLETAEGNLGVADSDLRRANRAGSTAGITGDGRSIAISSPIAGRVTAAPARLGTFVSTETELFRVTDPSRLQIIASIPPADATRIRTGDRVELATTDGATLAGTARAATGVVDPGTRQATVVIVPTASTTRVAPGQILQARIHASRGGAPSGAVTVPQDAVQMLAGRTVVFIRTAKGFSARIVQMGTRSGGIVEIISGLTAGTRIATANAFLLKAEIEKESAE